jgi:SAM-dependent methyltransferase
LTNTRAPGAALAEALERAVGRPPPFTPHDAPFWDDPHIGAGMLAAHLDPESDAASRRPETIRATVDHLLGALRLGRGSRLLDLGCGPGLYAERFASHGISVAGVDISPRSIRYAQAHAKQVHLDIEYRVGDYTAMDLGGPFDAAVLIYLDFGVLTDDGRVRLLEAVRSALSPGGRFAFDVHSSAHHRVPDGRIAVYRLHGGFWRPGPHLLAETTYRYDGNLDLNQHAVIDANGVTTYRVWDRAYSLRDLRRLLKRHGLEVESRWADLAGTAWNRASPSMGLVARRL